MPLSLLTFWIRSNAECGIVTQQMQQLITKKLKGIGWINGRAPAVRKSVVYDDLLVRDCFLGINFLGINFGIVELVPDSGR